jgi:hypothetical protein
MGPYTRLSRDPIEIRLLTILPGSGEQPIEVQLKVAQLVAEEEYETLSYFWGNPEDCGSITLNRTRFTVTINLQQALSALRSATESRRFWIDAICINQDDLEERSFQVALMGQIYRRSKETFVWLGLSSGYTVKTFEFLKSLPTNRFGTSEMMESMEEQLKGRLENNEHEWLIVKDGFWLDIAARPFWKRTWVVQEVVLSEKVTVLCGSNRIGWAKLADAAWKLKNATQEVKQSFWDSIPGLTHLEWIDEIKKICKTQHQMRTADLVVSLRGFDATNPLDKAYGILGLIDNATIEANYLKSVAEVYTDLVEASIAEVGSLDIICMKRDIAKLEPIPSWVPDWRYSRMSFPCHPLSLKWVSGHHLRNHLAPRDHPAVSADGTEGYAECWNAQGSSTALCTITRGSQHKLTVVGRMIGIINGMGDHLPFPAEILRPAFYDTLLSWEAIMLQKFGNRRSTKHPKILSDVFDQCLTIWNEKRLGQGVPLATRHIALPPQAQDETFGPYVEKDASLTEEACVLEAFIRTISGGRDNNWRKISAKKYADFWSTDSNVRSTWAFELEALQTPLNRRFMTLEGGQIGLGPVVAVENDIVAVLYGCSIPVVLRKSRDGGVILVGECYIQGLMEGAAVEEGNSERFPEVTWVIY